MTSMEKENVYSILLKIVCRVWVLDKNWGDKISDNKHLLIKMAIKSTSETIK